VGVARVGDDEVLDGVVRPPRPRDDVVHLAAGRQRAAAVEAVAALELCQPASQCLREGHPLRAEQVPPQSLLLDVDVVDPGDHPRPVELDQRAQERGETKQVIAGAGAEAHQPATWGVQCGEGHALPPVDVVEEGPVLAADDLEQPERVAGEGLLHHVEAPFVLVG
jgi:hypothetical protein